MIGTQNGGGVPVTAAIRPAAAADVDGLCDFFAGLSVESRYLRFFAPLRPGPGLVRKLSGGDGRTHALVAVRGGEIIGHGMTVDAEGGRAADVGVVVADAWQGVGVGSALLRALAAGAQARGVTSLTMDVLPGNRRMLALIARHWPAARVEHSGDGATFHVRLPRRPQLSPGQPPALASAG
jgi:ribosomal protein S18 acetylase RimI-like enzyme